MPPASCNTRFVVDPRCAFSPSRAPAPFVPTTIKRASVSRAMLTMLTSGRSGVQAVATWTAGRSDPIGSDGELTFDLLSELVPHLLDPERGAAKRDRRPRAILGAGDHDLAVGHHLGELYGDVESLRRVY